MARKVDPWRRIEAAAVGSLTPPVAVSRRGARRIAEIPPSIRRRLDRGEIETVVLVEWLAIDLPTLLRRTLPEVGLEAQTEVMVRGARARAETPFVQRLRDVGGDLFVQLGRSGRPAEVAFALATHPSDMVRALLVLALGADPGLALPRRLEIARRLAADRASSVRECTWDAIRPHLARELDAALGELASWVHDDNADVRRCASEATRPRGVWCAHIPELKTRPERARDLLDALRADPSRYVQTSVANWINDASKSRPDWVRALAARWSQESPTAETAWILNHGTRTLRRRGE